MAERMERMEQLEQMETVERMETVYDDNPVDVTGEVNFIWSIANKLRGPYQSDKYKNVIIPMTIIRRFECALAATKDKVVAKHQENPSYPPKAMYKIAGFDFYNVSPYTLAELCNDADHLAANFKSYLEGFSANVQDIVKSLAFYDEIKKMDANNRLYSVVKAFSELDLDPRTVDSIKMGYIFEDLIRRFSENAEAGDHYTARDLIRLMCSLALAEGCDDLYDESKVITICDQAAGTGGMLTTAYNFIKQLNPSADIRLFSQEVNPESYAECLAEMLIKGQRAENIRRVDTFKEDCFPGVRMRLVLENPPFGTAWSGKDAPEGDEKAVQEEYARGLGGRWGAGLPGGSDAQLLFVQSAIAKMDENKGRAVIVENGSPLFTGGTASGESQIRRYILENDLLEAIVALPTDLFYNTSIATYLWILSKNKRRERQGKVQLIDATELYHPLRKSLGRKRNEITPEDRKTITELYAEFSESERCKIFDNEDFMYREYAVMQPLQRSYSINDESIERLLAKGALNTLYDEGKMLAWQESEEELSTKDAKKMAEYEKNKPLYEQILSALNVAKSEEKYLSPEEFAPVLDKALEGVDVDNKLRAKIMDGLSVMDKTAQIQRDKKGNILYDKETKDTEIVPYKVDIEDYMAREVLPYIPDAKYFWEEDLAKKKPVIKTGAEIPFTRYFYKYQAPQPMEELEARFRELEKSIAQRVEVIFAK